MQAVFRRLRPLAVFGGMVTIAMVLSGCLYAMIPPATNDGPPPTLPPAAEGVPAELRPFYEQPLTWSTCAGLFDCATVQAPLDWENPALGTLEIAIIRHRAADRTANGAAAGSLLMNPGGPGASGIELVRDTMAYAVSPPLIEQFDIVGFDPRGVGESTAVQCFAAAEMDSFLFDIPADPRGSEAWEAELDARNAEFAQACDDNSDGILPYITTVNAARDLDLLRGVLGDSKLNYLGYSYGTFLGATYADLFPDRVGRLVLDGAVDPAIPGNEVGLVQVAGFESALRAYMQDCLSQAAASCPFTGSVDEGMAQLNALLHSVDASPLLGEDGRKLGADSLVLAVITALYAQENWPYLTMALDGAFKSDPAVAFMLADFYHGREGGYFMDNSTEAFNAYNCMDYPTEDETDDSAFEDRVREVAPTIGEFMLAPDMCVNWPYPPTGTRGEIHAKGAPEILVIGTTNDPATPYEWAVSLARQLQNGVLITRVGEGHTGFNKGNACVDRAVEDFLLSGTVPSGDLRCE